jgi:DNA-binding PadR family transcriptional regulator
MRGNFEFTRDLLRLLDTPHIISEVTRDMGANSNKVKPLLSKLADQGFIESSLGLTHGFYTGTVFRLTIKGREMLGMMDRVCVSLGVS